ncbi:hypothetical protein [Aneurinibacillus tyrosinisolvens]|uniref:hypothetical protein n=1 Tax=Aneurinibacillus tyrosinisolvens TaxID=1443435 RepID=UPI00063F0F89|nr:hypothetical protein [Aneurinibacillus tyrosinisolvens]
MHDIHGNKIMFGCLVKPLTGFWRGFEGEVLNIGEGDYPVTVKFEGGETNSYYPDHLEVIHNQ